MRLILALLLLAPIAHAQGPVELVTLTIAPFEAPIAPLQAPGTATVTARVSCALVDEAGRIPIRFAVIAKPSWATTLISPPLGSVDVQACEGGTHEFEAELIVSLDAQAPAFKPTPISVEATAGPPSRERRVSAVVNVSASYFSITDVQLDEPIVQMAPGTSHEFAIHVTNLGNGETRVEPTLAQAPETLTIRLPSALTVGSIQQDDGSNDGVLRIVATTAPESGFVNRVESFTIRVQSAYAADDSFAGEENSVSFVVTIRSGSGDSSTPAPAWLALAAVALAASWRRWV